MTNKKIIAMVLEKAGGQHALGRLLGIKFQSIQNWTKIPSGRVIDIETALDIPREELRPDLYLAPRPKRHV